MICDKKFSDLFGVESQMQFYMSYSLAKMAVYLIHLIFTYSLKIPYYSTLAVDWCSL